VEWDWVTHIGGLGLPWFATAAIILLTVLSTKGVDALLKWRKSILEERQYVDGHQQLVHDALVEELKTRIEKLESIVDKTSEKLERATVAHVKCEIEQERLRGELNVMKLKVERLENHDKRNTEHVEGLKNVLVEKAVSKIMDPPATGDAG
jgi:predicted nuclease with TOPRIM domain